MSKRILGVTLARGGSKAIPKKNIANINGIPLINYTIREALRSNLLSRYIISTDDSEIAGIARAAGADVPFSRPAELSTDTSTSAEALLHALDNVERIEEVKYDYVVEIMATNPLKTASDIDQCISLALEQQSDSAVAVSEVSDGHPARLKYIENGKLKPFVEEMPESRRQDLLPKAYIRCGSIYVTSTTFLRRERARYSATETLAYVMPVERVINIDEPIDLEMARILLGGA